MSLTKRQLAYINEERSLNGPRKEIVHSVEDTQDAGNRAAAVMLPVAKRARSWCATTPVEQTGADGARVAAEARNAARVAKAKPQDWAPYLLQKDREKVKASVARTLLKAELPLTQHYLQSIGEHRRDHPNDPIIDQAVRVTMQVFLVVVVAFSLFQHKN